MAMKISISSVECASIYHIIGPYVWISFPCQHVRHRKCCWCLTMVVVMYVQGLTKHAWIGPRLGVGRLPPQINHHPTNAYKQPPFDHQSFVHKLPTQWECLLQTMTTHNISVSWWISTLIYYPKEGMYDEPLYPPPRRGYSNWLEDERFEEPLPPTPKLAHGDGVLS